MEVSIPSERYRILIFGAERKGFAALKEPIDGPKYMLSFASYDDPARFQEFDGVIVFQGLFESFEEIKGYSFSTLKHNWDRDELDKRTKETDALLAAGGWACFVLDKPFVELGDHGEDLRQTDLVKRVLNAFGINRTRLRGRSIEIRSHVNELRRFFELYGAAWSVLTAQHGIGNAKTIASGPSGPVSIVSSGRVFFIPTLLPDSCEKAHEFFRLLADATISLYEKLRDEIPDWADEFKLPGEVDIVVKTQGLLEEVTRMEGQLSRLRKFKRVLVSQSEALVDAVAFALQEGLGLACYREEAFREDLQLRDAQGQCIALVEVKGTSRGGVQREHVNQADSHRERAERPSNFPSILIINTNSKVSNLGEKDQAVASEQVQHAARNNVLILRTLDLLNLVALRLAEQIDVQRVTAILTGSVGWLFVKNGEIELHDK